MEWLNQRHYCLLDKYIYSAFPHPYCDATDQNGCFRAFLLSWVTQIGFGMFAVDSINVFIKIYMLKKGNHASQDLNENSSPFSCYYVTIALL